jgi:hypothetical protein
MAAPAGQRPKRWTAELNEIRSEPYSDATALITRDAFRRKRLADHSQGLWAGAPDGLKEKINAEWEEQVTKAQKAFRERQKAAAKEVEKQAKLALRRKHAAKDAAELDTLGFVQVHVRTEPHSSDEIEAGAGAVVADPIAEYEAKMGTKVELSLATNRPPSDLATALGQISRVAMKARTR